MCYAFTPDSVLPKWLKLYSDIVPLIYVNETICLVICPSTRFKSIVYGQRWIIWCHSKFYDIPFFSLTDCEWLYNLQLKTRRVVLFLPPSDAYVRSFLYLLYTLIKLYYTKALSDPALSLALDWISLLRRPRIPASYHSATTFHWYVINIQFRLRFVA